MSRGSACGTAQLPIFRRALLFQTSPLLFLVFLLPLPLFLGCLGGGQQASVMLPWDGFSARAAPRRAQRDPLGPRCPVDQLPAELVQHRLPGHGDGHRVVCPAPAESGVKRARGGPSGGPVPTTGTLTRRRGRAPRTPPCRRTRSRAPG